jgi:hypothetical protein
MSPELSPPVVVSSLTSVVVPSVGSSVVEAEALEPCVGPADPVSAGFMSRGSTVQPA